MTPVEAEFQAHKREALQQVLGSAVFRRADSLRTLLEYLGAQEAKGRGNAVTEYEIGREAMGRPESFAPDVDSSVRSRIHSLRRKLDEFYAGEGSGNEWRIELPKGSYCLHYSRAPEREAPPEAQTPRLKPPSTIPWRAFALGVVSAAALFFSAIVFWQFSSSEKRVPSDRLLKAAWGPMLGTGASATILVATPIQLFVRDFGQSTSAGDPSVRFAPPPGVEFREWYQQWRRHPLGPNAFLHPNHHSPLWGDMAAALAAMRILAAHGTTVDVAPAYRVHPVGLRGKNIVLFGRGEYSDSIAELMPSRGLSIEYNQTARLLGVHNREPRPGEPEWWLPSADLRRNYGLVTVLAQGGSGASARRTIIFGGINSDGSEAGMSMLTTPEKLAAVEAGLRAGGRYDWSPPYQVVVKTQSIETYSFEADFEFVRILRP